MNLTKHRSFVFVALFAIVAAACGGSGHASTSGGSSGGSCATKAGVTGPVNDTGSKAATGSAITVDAQDVKFTPSCTTAVPAGTFSLTVTNTGSLLHNVSIPDQHIDKDVAPGASVTVQVQIGTTPVVYFCKYHHASGMVGALVPQSA